MRVLIAVALLMCGCAKQPQKSDVREWIPGTDTTPIKASPTPNPNPKDKLIVSSPEVDDWLAILNDSGFVAVCADLDETGLITWKPRANGNCYDEDRPKQEKAWPCTLPVSPKIADMACGEIWTAQGWRDFSEYLKLVTQPLPFDLPAKGFYMTFRSGVEPPVTTSMFSCKDVSPDWKQRVLLDSADGKHHCYAFYLLEQKP